MKAPSGRIVPRADAGMIRPASSPVVTPRLDPITDFV
jgi:hypothetical protein